MLTLFQIGFDLICAIQQLLRIVPYISKKLVTVANCKKKKGSISNHSKAREDKGKQVMQYVFQELIYI